jgi:pyrroline-5-carboxylate reductase
VSGNSLNNTTRHGPVRTIPGPVAIIGAGNMGGAIARALLTVLQERQLVLIDPNPNPAIARAMNDAGVAVLADAAGLKANPPAIILLAVKPQVMSEVAPDYRQFASTALFVSIAAGTTLASLDAWLGAPAALVRCMPNLPASIGMGITAGVAKQGTPPEARAAAETLMRSVGDFVWLENESQIDAVTAVSGSGPAYVFHLVECLAAAARSQGLPDEIAKVLARRTVEGAGALLAASGQAPEVLRASVTSPGGTTEAALKVLMDGQRNERLLVDAVAAATRRARELAG